LIEISDQKVIFHEAKDLWGKDTYSTEDEVLKRVNQKGAKAIVIGPAGENLIRYAVIENDYWRSLGRTGVGAVMGTKKIKAIAFHGEKKRPVAYPDRLEQFAKETLERGKECCLPIEGCKFDACGLNNAVGGFPSKYWHLEPSKAGKSAEALIERCTNRLPA
jgi:aldehyde:ferredoxin oxidoreductase